MDSHKPRDMRPELSFRLQLIEEACARITAESEAKLRELEAERRGKLQPLEQEAELYRKLMETENQRFGDTKPTLAIPVPTVPLADFFVRLVEERAPRIKDELRQRAVEAGYFPDGENAGRAVHTTLLNICRARRIVDLGDGMYGPAPRKISGISALDLNWRPQ